MSEDDKDPNDPNAPADPVEPAAEHPPVDLPAPPASAAFAEPPAPAATSRWRDRVFRMRSVAAVAVAGVIIGAAGGAVTTALVSGDHRDHDDQHQIGRGWEPGMMPVVPPDGRMRFPGDGSDGQLPDMPVPPGDGSEDGTDDGSDDGTDGGTDEPSSLSRS